jgi:hypothetical protein
VVLHVATLPTLTLHSRSLRSLSLRSRSRRYYGTAARLDNSVREREVVDTAGKSHTAYLLLGVRNHRDRSFLNLNTCHEIDGKGGSLLYTSFNTKHSSFPETAVDVRGELNYVYVPGGGAVVLPLST